MGRQISGASIDVNNKEDVRHQKPEIKASERQRQAPEKANAESSDEIEIQPTLVGFFGEDRASPSAFFKVLRKNDVKRFRSQDQEAAAKLMQTKDPDGERLWGLMAQSSAPEPIDAWVWGAAQARLKEELGEAFDPLGYDAVRIFKSVLRELAVGLNAEQKENQKRAENVLRLAICWLIEKRSLKTWQVAEQLRSVFFADPKVASQFAQRAVQRGKSGELRLAAAMSALGDQMVKVADEEQVRERSISADLRHRVNDANEKIEKLRLDLEEAKTTIAEHEGTIIKLEHALYAERHNSGHNIVGIKAKQRALLRERLEPLLADAIDALEIEPSAPGVALRRVKAAIFLIQEATK